MGQIFLSEGLQRIADGRLVIYSPDGSAPCCGCRGCPATFDQFPQCIRITVEVLGQLNLCDCDGNTINRPVAADSGSMVLFKLPSDVSGNNYVRQLFLDEPRVWSVRCDGTDSDEGVNYSSSAEVRCYTPTNQLAVRSFSAFGLFGPNFFEFEPSDLLGNGFGFAEGVTYTSKPVGNLTECFPESQVSFRWERVECPTDGACCKLTGECEARLEEDCTVNGGEFRGEDEPCETADCQPFGACCLPDESCEQRTEASCTLAGGAWQGAGTDCETTNCGPVLGACCENTFCSETIAADCAGQWFGGQTCATVTCPDTPGSCCVVGECVPNKTFAECQALDGRHFANVSCAFLRCDAPDPKRPIGGACCLGGRCFLAVSPGICEANGGVFIGGSCFDGDPCGPVQSVAVTAGDFF